MPKRMRRDGEGVRETPISLAPLDFEEALRDLLQVPTPPKNEEANTEREPPKRGRKRKQPDTEKGSQ